MSRAKQEAWLQRRKTVIDSRSREMAESGIFGRGIAEGAAISQIFLAGGYGFGLSEVIAKKPETEPVVDQFVVDSVLPLLAVAAVLSLPAAIVSRNPRERKLILAGMALALVACAGAVTGERTLPAPGATLAVATEPATAEMTAIYTATATEAPTGTETPFFAGGPVFTADVGELLRQRLETNLALPVCNQSGNQAAGDMRWESPQAAEIEAQGGNIQSLYGVLRQKLPVRAQIRLCANSEGWFFRVTTADGVPIWNQVRGDDGRWHWADHPNFIPVDEGGNIGEWRPVKLPGNRSSVWTPLVLDGVPVEVQIGGDGNPKAYFDPVSGEMEPLLRPTSALSTPKPDALPQELLLTEAADDKRATPEPETPIPPTATVVFQAPTLAPPEPTATEAPARHPSWPEGWSPPPGWPADTVYRGGNSFRLYRYVPVNSSENPMPWELPDWTRVTDCRTDTYCPLVSGGVDKGNGLTVSQSIELARQIAGDNNVRIRVIYIGGSNSPDSNYVSAITVQILNP